MSLATETSTQNTIISLSILSLSLGTADAAAASIMPIIYGTSNTSTNVAFGLIGWKIMGWSKMPKTATFGEMWGSYRDLLAAGKEGGGGAGDGDNNRLNMARVAPSSSSHA